MFQGQGGAAAADLPKGELAMPSVTNGKGGDDSLVEKLLQADRDVNLPDEWNVFGGIKAGREGSKHVGRPGGGEGGELGAEEGWGGGCHDYVSEES